MSTSVWQPMVSATAVETLADLTGLSLPAPLPEGVLILVSATGEYYRFVENSGAAISSPDVIATHAGGDSRWVRTNFLESAPIILSGRTDAGNLSLYVQLEEGFAYNVKVTVVARSVGGQDYLSTVHYLSISAFVTDTTIDDNQLVSSYGTATAIEAWNLLFQGDTSFRLRLLFQGADVDVRASFEVFKSL